MECSSTVTLVRMVHVAVVQVVGVPFMLHRGVPAADTVLVLVVVVNLVMVVSHWVPLFLASHARFVVHLPGCERDVAAISCRFEPP